MPILRHIIIPILLALFILDLEKTGYVLGRSFGGLPFTKRQTSSRKMAGFAGDFWISFGDWTSSKHIP